MDMLIDFMAVPACLLLDGVGAVGWKNDLCFDAGPRRLLGIASFGTEIAIIVGIVLRMTGRLV